MVLAAFILVLAAAATFAAGIATSRTSDGLVYVSILLSLAAFAILAIASIRARQAAREGVPQEGWTDAGVRAMDTEAATGPLLGGLDETQLDMAPNWKRDARQRWRGVDAPAARDDLDDELDRVLDAEEDEADTEVPVEPVPVGAVRDEYDDEDDWAPEDELDEQDQFEEIGDLNFGVYREPGAEGPALAEPAFDEPLFDEPGLSAVEPEPVGALEEFDELEELEDLEEFDEVDEVEEEEPVLDIPEPPPVRRAPPARRPVSAGAGRSSLDLIDDYDDLTAAEIVPLLDDLELEDLRWVQRRERSGGQRTSILNQVDELIAGGGGVPRTRSATAPTRKAPARKAPARKAPAKKAPAKKKTAKKKTAAKKTAAKKTTGRAKKTTTTRAKKTPTKTKKASPAKRASKSSGRR